MSKSKYGYKEAGPIPATNTQLDIIGTNIVQVIKVNHLNVKYNIPATFSKKNIIYMPKKHCKNIIYLHRSSNQHM